VESLVNITWQKFEFVVIDGGATGGSAAYIESQGGNIDYRVSEPETGIYNEMNKVIKAVEGSLLVYKKAFGFNCNSKI
jgi:glycosyltransferase involved in cell wall biosynthesis